MLETFTILYIIISFNNEKMSQRPNSTATKSVDIVRWSGLLKIPSNFKVEKLKEVHLLLTLKTTGFQSFLFFLVLMNKIT